MLKKLFKKKKSAKPTTKPKKPPEQKMAKSPLKKVVKAEISHQGEKRVLTAEGWKRLMMKKKKS